MPKGTYQRITLLQRIENSIVKQENGCWEWIKHIDKYGYGQISVKEDGIHKSKLIHRVMYELKHGTIQDGLLACHTCDNRKCCNPDHIFLGTAKDNAEDMVAKGRSVVSSGAFTSEKTKGEKNGRSLLTQEDVDEIRARRDKGLKYGELKAMAEEFGIAYVTIQKIVANKIWN